MKLALVNLSIDAITAPMGLCYIATYLEKYSNFKDTVIIDINWENIFQKVEEIKPDIIGLSAMTAYYPAAIRIAKKIKEKHNIPIIIGGNHISSLPECLKDCFDIGVLGEGERTTKELVDLYIKKGKFLPNDLRDINGIVFHENDKLTITEERQLIEPLDKIPIPNYQYLNKNYSRKRRSFVTGDREVTYTLFTSRGCPYRCVYCSPTVLWKKVRFFSLEHIIREIKKAMGEYGATLIAFSDDLFAVSNERMRGLYEKLKEADLIGKVKFAGTLRANLVDDELCILLKKMGFVCTSTGYESGNEEMLKYLKANSVTVKQNYNAIRLFEKHKLNNFGMFIMASPGETLDQMRDTLKLIKFAYNHHTAFIYVFMMKAFPKTKIWDIAKERGLVSNDMDWEIMNLFVDGMHEANKPLMLDKNIDIKEFKKIHNKALMYSRLIVAKRFIRSFIKHPIGTLQEMGNPWIFIKKAITSSNTLKIIQKEKGISTEN
jgi:anaerobic magnesium-protoporphyrin IX monomethyl ester cyclase